MQPSEHSNSAGCLTFKRNRVLKTSFICVFTAAYYRIMSYEKHALEMAKKAKEPVSDLCFFGGVRRLSGAGVCDHQRQRGYTPLGYCAVFATTSFIDPGEQPGTAACIYPSRPTLAAEMSQSSICSRISNKISA